MYLTYDEYYDMGGAMTDEDAYARHAARADAIINRMTHGRIKDESPVRPCAMYAAFALIEAMHSDSIAASDGREIASMTNDGMSVTYTNGGSSATIERNKRYAGIVREYLEYETDANGTLILYAGVDA